MSLPYRIPRGLGYGTYEKLPDLPDGWSFSQSPNDFLFVSSPTGKVYYVDFPEDKQPALCAFDELILGERRKANVWDVIRTRGKLKRGQSYRTKPEHIAQ